jgi:aminopeptidase N
MPRDSEPRLIRLADYTPPTHLIDSTELRFDISEGVTHVTSRLAIRRNPANPAAHLRLDGQQLQLVSVAVDGEALGHNEYQLDADSLTLIDLPERCVVEIETRIVPENNTALEGLYRSGNMYCTQCEAQGFRKITYYPDRPDVLAPFTTTIAADAERYPVLLSNGNPVADRALPDGRREVTWLDPHPKPSYLFALVAGDLALLEDAFETCSGRRVALRIYSEPHNIGQCEYAMDVLKRAMRWDEQAFGREYDLDVFMIVAVEDFNMGAMENKGLNIFNTSCVLATPQTATDAAYQHVEAVVAHEYFHNWSGNRVTCRDWFQLSLKEGFTVYRDAEFSSDMNSRSVKRIEDVEQLRTHQFAEDAGPMAHPVRPDAYMEISNFYTRTVYDKGAEVVRMAATMLGPEGFRRGCDLYFARHDGQAVTTEDFLRALEDANDIDMARFRYWYSQAGTPVVRVAVRRKGDRLELCFEQSCPSTPDQPHKEPFHIPLAFGLLDQHGRDMLGAAGREHGYALALNTDADRPLANPYGDGTLVVHLTAPRTTVTVDGAAGQKAVSLLRGFSAPVRLAVQREASELAFLAERDSDGFSRWDAMRSLQCAILEQLRNDGDADVSALITLYRGIAITAVDAADDGEAKAMLAEMLALPTEAYLHEEQEVIDIDGIHRARNRLRTMLGSMLHDAWLSLYEANRSSEPYQATGPQIARRALKNLAMSYLVAGSSPGSAQAATVRRVVLAQLEDADNLTDRLAALVEVVSSSAFDAATRDDALAAFYGRWRQEKLVIDRWFAVQAGAERPDALSSVIELEQHAAFDRRNPNRVRALYGAFANQNHVNFHALDGSGYRFLADRVAALDAINPQVAARLLMPLTRARRVDPVRGRQMTDALQTLARPGLSPDVTELVTKSLR